MPASLYRFRLDRSPSMKNTEVVFLSHARTSNGPARPEEAGSFSANANLNLSFWSMPSTDGMINPLSTDFSASRRLEVGLRAQRAISQQLRALHHDRHTVGKVFSLRIR